MKSLFLFLFLATSLSLYGQETTQKADVPKVTSMSRPWIWGAHFQAAWNGVTGPQLPGNFFYKPGVAGALLLEYYPWPWLGMGTGLGYTSRGPGKINPDLDQSLGNPDSTYREHYYFRTMDVPFYVALRSPSFNQNRCRLSTRIGGGFSRNFKSTYMFHSVEDGFHDYKDMKDDFYKTDFFTHISAGLDLNSGSQTMFQVHLYWQKGQKNIFRTDGVYNGFTGYNQAFGLQLSFFY